MNKNISIFKKIGIFSEYKKTVRSLEPELSANFGVRVDKAYRLYNVINIPPEVVGEPYNLRKSDIDKISEKFIKEYLTSISEFLDTRGLRELCTFYEIKKVDKYSYLVVFGFSLFKSNEYYDNIRYKLVPAGIVIFIILSLISFL